ncbi:MAG: hypothetical protein LBK76_10200, partial [Verrucomicrobiales bacterium]|nr:hypothetical protein [Verrucomicrobiales bacterium]
MNPKLTLLTLCALSVCFAAKRLGIRASVYLLAYFTALNIFADVKYVTSGQDITEDNQTYEAVTGSNALRVTSGTYHGTNIVLSSTANASTAYVTSQGSLTLTGGTITANADLAVFAGLQLNGTSTAMVENVVVVLNGDNRGYGLNALNDATISVKGGSVTVSGEGGEWGHFAVYAENHGRIYVEDLLVTVSATKGTGVLAEHYGFAELHNMTVHSQANGILAQRGSTLIGDRVTIVADHNAVAINLSGTLILNDSSVTATGTQQAILSVNANEFGAAADLIINGGTLAGNVDLLSVMSSTGINQVTLNNVDTTGVTGDNSIKVSAADTSATTVDINGGIGGLNGDITNSGNGTLTVNLDHSAITGDVINQGDGALVITLDNNSTGTGGFAGGNLITGGDSAWTFDKD